MTREEYDKIQEYSDRLAEMNKSTKQSDKWLDDDFEKEIFEFFDRIIDNEDWKIIASDTHRWVSTDGFYEVQFEIETGLPDGEIYVTTKCGDWDLEEEWSKNNPQEVYTLRDCYMSTTWNWHYFVDCFLSEINEQIEAGNFKLDE